MVIMTTRRCRFLPACLPACLPALSIPRYDMPTSSHLVSSSRIYLYTFSLTHMPACPLIAYMHAPKRVRPCRRRRRAAELEAGSVSARQRGVLGYHFTLQPSEPDESHDLYPGRLLIETMLLLSPPATHRREVIVSASVCLV